MRDPRVYFLPALCAMAWAAADAGSNRAFGGAWLLPPGAGQIIAYLDYSDSSYAFDMHGKLVKVPAYQKFEIGGYLEYGLADWLTIVAAPAYDRVRSPVAGQSYDGPGESEIGARVGLYRSETSVFSVQASIRSPGASFDSLGLAEVRRSASLDLRAMAGKSFTLGTIEGFAEAQAGYRFYAANQPGEWRIDLAAGLRPLPNFLFMMQSYTSIGKGPKPFGEIAWTKIQPSVVYSITPQWSLQAGGFVTVWGKNAGRELGPMIGLWYRF
ncbi:MAG TPA: hypothetical protein VEK34_15470 [Methylocella sp.]|nr:hypothetical protein [Methylocella sp.]